MWHGSEEYWNGGAWERMNEYEDRCLRLEQAWEEWHRACMEMAGKGPGDGGSVARHSAETEVLPGRREVFHALDKS